MGREERVKEIGERDDIGGGGTTTTGRPEARAGAALSEGPESPFKPECFNMGDQKGEKKDAGRGKRKV